MKSHKKQILLLEKDTTVLKKHQEKLVENDYNVVILDEDSDLDSIDFKNIILIILDVNYDLELKLYKKYIVEKNISSLLLIDEKNANVINKYNINSVIDITTSDNVFIAIVDNIILNLNDSHPITKDRLDFLWKNSPIGFYLLDSAGKILDANSAGSEILGFNSVEQLTSNVQSIAPQIFKNKIEFEKILEQLTECNVVFFSTLVKRKNDSEFNGNIIIRKYAVNEDLLYEAILVDTSSSCDLNEIIKEKENKYRFLFENMLDAFALHEIIFDKEGNPVDYRFISVNPAFETLTGLKSEDIVDKTVLDVLPNTEKEWIERYGNVVKNGEPIRFENFSSEMKKHFEVYAYRPEKDRFACVFRDVTENRTYQKDIEKSLEEKETLIRELYHRTKNNMQVIIALLSLQSEYTDSDFVKEVFTDTKNRIHSMALVHRMLYENNDLSRINLKDYINVLVKNLMQSYQIDSNRVQYLSDLEDVWVIIDTAIPCGLLLNEIISNAFKHAFPDNRNGEINIKLSKVDEKISLKISDNGKGYDENFDIMKNSRLGIKNIFSISKSQLKSETKFSTKNGFSFEFLFEDKYYKARV